MNHNIIFRNFSEPKTTLLFQTFFTYAHSSSFCLPVVTENCRIALQKCMFPQLEGRICKQKHVLPHAEGTTFTQKCPLLHAEGITFIKKRPLLSAEAYIFIKKWGLPTAEGSVFNQKRAPLSAESSIFTQKRPLPHLLKSLIILMFWLFFAARSILLTRNPSGTIIQYFINPPGYFPNGITPGTKSLKVCLIENCQNP